MCTFSLVTSADSRQSAVTDLYNEVLNPSWQCMEFFEDFPILLLATYLRKFPFCSEKLMSGSHAVLSRKIDVPAIQHEQPCSWAYGCQK
jgi:hypothetical protein